MSTYCKDFHLREWKNNIDNKQSDTFSRIGIQYFLKKVLLLIIGSDNLTTQFVRNPPLEAIEFPVRIFIWLVKS